MRPVVIVEVLPLAELLGEQVDVVGDTVLVQQLVKLFVINCSTPTLTDLTRSKALDEFGARGPRIGSAK